MQDDSSLRWHPPPNKTCLPRENALIQIQDDPRKNMSAKKNYFTINFKHSIHQASQILSTITNQRHSLHFTVSAFISLTLSPNIYILFTVTLHNILSLFSSNALDKQHFLTPFTVTSGEMCWHAIMIHIE